MRAVEFAAAAAIAAALTLPGTGPAAAAPATAIPGDGVYLVGIDIQPGWYESAGTPDPANGCDYRRLWKVEGDNTDMNYIIGNDFTRASPVRAQIDPTDVAFRTVGCGSWRMIPAPPPTPLFQLWLPPAR
ncbi:hypothetical protein ACTD5D_10655 [Nocardia takedensis]|uniref:hypothetical protein n=1 Tax=Nocardia takedensis TaxID=259390 RepID=UPI000308A139|nr:hypothetical protein [Nocardia takedensis]